MKLDFTKIMFGVLMPALVLLGSCRSDKKAVSTGPEGTPTFGPAAVRPKKSVLPDEILSCSIYKNTECRDGKTYSCRLYDATAGDWVSAPDPLTERIYYTDRYYDLYQRMEGQHATIEFTEAMPPGTPEEVWGAPDKFEKYDDHGDSSGWTGTALQSAAARYSLTGTEADYLRMLDQFESAMFQYTGNDIPGMMMRSHYAMLEPGAPAPVGHPGKSIVNYIEPGDWHMRYPLSDARIDELGADYYKSGVEINGEHYGVTPVWMGDASRDMYVRSLPGMMLAYDLLGEGEREDKIREEIKTEVTCTLKRMKKMRVTNLQQNTELMGAIDAYFNTGVLKTEPGDYDYRQVDTLIGYVMEQPMPDHMDKFDSACPADLPFEVDPEYDIDASDQSGSMRDLIDIVTRMQRKGEVAIAWIQLASVRGSDALFVTQWALAGYYFTGDKKFLDFLDQLIDETNYWEIIDLMGSFWLPKWCSSHFAPSLSYPTMWNLQTRISRRKYPGYWNRLGTYIAEEIRSKELSATNDFYFGILYSAMVDDIIDPDRLEYSGRMSEMLNDIGQTSKDTIITDPIEPRRNYSLELIDNPPAEFTAAVDAGEIVLEELSSDDRAICEMPVEIFGISIEAGGVSNDDPRAAEGLPIKFRIPGIIIWEQDPYNISRPKPDSYAGKMQYAGQGLSVAYWSGRMLGLLSAGNNTALGWRDEAVGCTK